MSKPRAPIAPKRTDPDGSATNAARRAGDRGRAAASPARERSAGQRAASPAGPERGRKSPASPASSPTARGPRRVLVTAGPTREYIDPVRYISNESTGKMGFALAAAAAARGDRVTLIAGPVNQPTPPGVERVDVESAREMLAELKRHFRSADALFMTAAVADWRPKRRLSGKWRKKDGGTQSASIELVRNPDLLATVSKRKGARLVVGFALETGDGRRRALAKLRRKNADYIVLNDQTALGADRSTVTILGRDGSSRTLTRRPKPEIAAALAALEAPSGA